MRNHWKWEYDVGFVHIIPFYRLLLLVHRSLSYYSCLVAWNINVRRKFRSQTSDNMDRWESRGGKSQGGEEKEVRRSEKRKREKKEDASARKGGKVAIHCVFPMRGSKSNRLAKAAGAEPAGQMRDEKLHTKQKCTKHLSFGALLEVAMSKKCTPLWREAHFQVKMYKAHHAQRTFGSPEVEKVDAVVARSTFPSQTCKRQCSDHFLTFRCRKSARRNGAKHISKSKCTHHSPAPFWKFWGWKIGRRFCAKHISKSKVSKAEGFDLFLTFRCRKNAH